METCVLLAPAKIAMLHSTHVAYMQLALAPIRVPLHSVIMPLLTPLHSILMKLVSCLPSRSNGSLVLMIDVALLMFALDCLTTPA